MRVFLIDSGGLSTDAVEQGLEAGHLACADWLGAY
jgi:hypothetical protein